MRLVRTGKFPIIPPPAAALLAVLLLAPGRAALAADVEEAHYNAVVSLYNAGQWQAALAKIAEREKQDMPDAQRAKYIYARGLALEKGGRAADAAQAYRELAEKYASAPEANRACLALIYIDYASKNYDSVIARQGRIAAAQLAPEEKKQLALMTAESHYAKKDWKPALAAYQSALALGADKAALAAKLFEVYYQSQMQRELLQISGAGVPGIQPGLLAAIRAEAFLALNQFKEAEAEAAKVARGDAHFPRASLILAQALIRGGKVKEAGAPLQAAIDGMKDPPAPPAAYLALAECRLANGDAAGAAQAARQAEAGAKSLPASDRRKFEEQALLLQIRVAVESKDERRITEAVQSARGSLPPDKLPELLYLRLYHLKNAARRGEILRSMPEDHPVLRKSVHDAPATLIFAAALKEEGREAEARQMLADLLKRKPGAAEALDARRELAYAALKTNDFTAARDYLKAILAAPAAPKRFDADALNEMRYNYALAVFSAGEKDQALGALKQIAALNATNDLAARAFALSGQIYADRKDFRKAAGEWQKALDLNPGRAGTDMRDRLGRAWFAAGDFARANEQFTKLAEQSGGALKLARETREAWARSLFGASNYAGAAAMYGDLFKAFPDTPAYAYEAAVCHERSEQWAESAKWYAASAEKKEQLPPDYAGRVEKNLAGARLKAGAGGQDLSYWLGQMGTNAPARDFNAALITLLKILRETKPDASTHSALEAAQRQYPPTAPRYFGIGALRLEMLANEADPASGRKLAAQLAREFEAHEKGMAGQDWSVTVAPAMIHYYKGEADRLSGDFAGALAAYETVLSAYPYNEWPDAAAFGAAECYAALGDTATALAKWNEILKTGAPASAKWREAAKKRIAETQPGGK